MAAVLVPGALVPDAVVPAAPVPVGLMRIVIDPTHDVYVKATKFFGNNTENFFLSEEVGEYLMELGHVGRQADKAEVVANKSVMTWLWETYGTTFSTDWTKSRFGKPFKIPDSDIFYQCFGNVNLHKYVAEFKPLLLQSEVELLKKHRDKLFQLTRKGIDNIINGFNLSDKPDAARDGAQRKRKVLKFISYIFSIFKFILSSLYFILFIRLMPLSLFHSNKLFCRLYL